MAKTGIFTKALAVVGALLAWLPIVATVVISVAGSIRDRVFRFDYLMPAEFFPPALVGGGLLVWAALRARSRRGLIGWSLGLAAGLLVGAQGLAVITGIASGEAAPAGWRLALVIAFLVGYTAALVALEIGGVLLVRDLWRHSETSG